MLKALKIFVIATWLMLGWPGLSEKYQGRSPAKQDTPHPSQSAPPPSRPVVAATAPPATPCSQHDPCYTENASPQKLLPEWRTPEWVIVYVTIVYSAIAGWTLIAIRRQGLSMRRQTTLLRRSADAMRDSVKLQEVQCKQWVEVGLWQNKTHHNVTGAVLTLAFEVGNSTKYPLTLKKLTTGRKGKESSSSSVNYSIAPEDSYLAYYSFNATPQEMELYKQNKLEVVLSIETEIRDVLGKDNPPQHFTHTVTFGPTRCDSIDQPPHLQMLIKRTS